MAKSEEKIDTLFSKKGLTLNDIDLLCEKVVLAENERKEIWNLTEKEISKSNKLNVRALTGKWLCNNYDEDIIEQIGSLRSNSLEYNYVSYRLYKEKGFYLRAATCLNNAIKSADKDEKEILKALYIECLLLSREKDKGIDEFKKFKFDKTLPAENNYLKGLIAEKSKNMDLAVTSYQKALEVNPKHFRAKFHLAYCYDLNGEDDKAIDLYEELLDNDLKHEGVLLNLGILYEDKSEYKKALNCYKKVLNINPLNWRASMFIEDVEASMDMYYDEEAKKREARKLQLLNTPVSELKMSARSRNCLHKLKLFTLGDLVQQTENQLRTCKNMGENSLIEIKEILRQRHLSLVESKEGKPAPEGADLPIYELGLSPRCLKALSQLKLNTIGDLINKTEKELLECKNFGLISLEEIKVKLAQRRLYLAKD